MPTPGTRTRELRIAIVNFNSGDHLQSCLESVALTLPGYDWQAAVVDNASSDGSERAAEAAGRRVKLLRNDENIGFAPAINRAIAAGTTDRVLILNPDCRLKPGAVDALMAEFDRHPESAVLGPCILDADGSVQGSARGDPTVLTGLFGRSTLLSKLLPGASLFRQNVRSSEPIPENETSLVVDWVSGACMLARCDALNRLGGFDERYFLYWEDADLCRRLRTAGYTIRYVPRAEVEHIVGRSSRSVPDLAIRAFHRSAHLYYTTHVANGRWDPRRVAAHLILSTRCRWKLLMSRLRPRR